MIKLYWFLLIISSVLYALPFLFSTQLWWLVFFFPIPLLYLTRTINLSFVHGYIWGCITFSLHLSGGIYVITCMAHEAWMIGILIGIAMIMYQALFPAILFWCVTYVVRIFSIQLPVVRLCMWAIALLLFIMWTDCYSLYLFGRLEGYPLMQPLILLAHKPYLLYLVTAIGKFLCLLFFMLFSISYVLLLWYKNCNALFFVCIVTIAWFFPWGINKTATYEHDWQRQIKTLPYMVHTTAQNPIIMIRTVANQLKNIIAKSPATEIVIMPESAFNISNFADIPEMIQLWNKNCLGKSIHFIFGASRWHNTHYYNSLHWVYNGVLQNCFDKRHAMLISERLVSWMDNNIMRQTYFNSSPLVTISSDVRTKLILSEIITFIPYICSELFFNEFPDDTYGPIPIIAIINDILFTDNFWTLYIGKLLLLLARYKAIVWKRDIVYVSYQQSVFIDRYGNIKEIN